MDMKLVSLLLLYLASDGTCEEIFLSYSSSPQTTNVKIPKNIKPDEGVALRTFISDPQEEGGGGVDDSPSGINEKDYGTINLSVLASPGSLKNVTVNVTEKTVNNTLPLCFDAKPKNFSSLENFKVTSRSDLVNDKIIIYRLVAFNCSSVIAKSINNGGSGSNTGNIVGIIFGILLMVTGICIILFQLKKYTPTSTSLGLVPTNGKQKDPEIPLLVEKNCSDSKLKKEVDSKVLDPKYEMDEITNLMSKTSVGKIEPSIPSEQYDQSQEISPNNQSRQAYRDKPSMSIDDKDLRDQPLIPSHTANKPIIKPSNLFLDLSNQNLNQPGHNSNSSVSQMLPDEDIIMADESKNEEMGTYGKRSTATHDELKHKKADEKRRLKRDENVSKGRNIDLDVDDSNEK